MNKLEEIKKFIQNNLNTFNEDKKDDNYLDLSTELAHKIFNLNDEEIKSIRSKPSLYEFIKYHIERLHYVYLSSEETRQLNRFMSDEE